jgi:hypothetical protein
MLRKLGTVIVGLALRRTRWRFDKSWRWGSTRAKAFVYAYLCSSVGANYIGDGDPVRHWWRHS